MEQPLPPNGACLLGSINLTKFVIDPFTHKARFDWEKFRKVVSVFSRMLDNVVEINNLPLKAQQEEIKSKRRHGMGFLGLGSTMTMLRMKYGSEESITFAEAIAREMAIESLRTGVALAKEKGMAPILKKTFTITGEMLSKRPEMVFAGYKVGEKIQGKKLLAYYSRYMQRIAEVDPGLIEEIARYGIRYTHATSIAPTGTISLSLGNNASNGIEPTFGHSYKRNIIVPGKKTKEQTTVYSFELLAYRAFVNPNASDTATDAENRLPDYFVTADQVTPAQHVAVQAAVQKWIDSSISKTVNVPTDIPFDEFKDLYLLAYRQGLKGCTTFRFNPEVHGGVLVKDKDLDSTIYQFVLEDGTVVEAKGSDKIVYDGEEHVAANLFDAIKENYYGKFN